MAGMKSALELAMEKINAQKAEVETVVSLTDAQRQEISDLRKQYDAKIAEKDIMLQADIRQLIQRRPPQEAMAAAQELREKFKDDPTKMNAEVMKLYKDYGVNPVSGCLPMMIQIPIFFGLFTMLRQAVELRNASFLWVRVLSQPDTIAHLPGLGWPINILPLIMAGTSFWMTHVTPKSGDATQQRVMMFMPLIFVVFCYNFAAALALYYTTQNLFTILQLYQNRSQPLPKLEKVNQPAKRKGKAR